MAQLLAPPFCPRGLGPQAQKPSQCQASGVTGGGWASPGQCAGSHTRERKGRWSSGPEVAPGWEADAPRGRVRPRPHGAPGTVAWPHSGLARAPTARGPGMPRGMNPTSLEGSLLPRAWERPGTGRQGDHGNVVRLWEPGRWCRSGEWEAPPVGTNRVARGLQQPLNRPPGEGMEAAAKGWTDGPEATAQPAAWERKALRAGWGAVSEGLLSCFFFHLSVQTPHFTPRGCAARKTQRKAQDNDRSRGPLAGAAGRQPSPRPYLTPQARSRTGPPNLPTGPAGPRHRALVPPAPFQNAGLQTLTCTVRRQAFAQTLSPQTGSHEPALKGTSPHLPPDPSGPTSWQVA